MHMIAKVITNSCFVCNDTIGRFHNKKANKLFEFEISVKKAFFFSTFNKWYFN